MPGPSHSFSRTANDLPWTLEDAIMTEDTFHEREAADSGESYFVSMTDMMVGMLFLFIIMLMAFALSYRDTTSKLVEGDKTRQEILEELQRTLRESGVKVDIDPERGVMRLPEKILFSSGSAELSPAGQSAVAKLANALNQVLPCHTRLADTTRKGCENAERATVEAVFIEGHTDNVPLAKGASFPDNWALSAARAIRTYQELTKTAPGLDELRNKGSQRLLGVSGYADRRPVPGREHRSPTSEPENRRIDLRFVMDTPRVSELK